MTTEVDSVGAAVLHNSTNAGPRVEASDSKVVISVDDTTLLSSPTEPVRARSLNKLTSMDDDLNSPELYKCPSFPRLQKHAGSLPYDNSTNCSMTHLETNSMSPRVSTDNLTNITREDMSRDHLNLGGYQGLMRSISSRTVDELPPLELPVYQFERLGHTLSKRANNKDKQPPLVSRSTSCPSMAYTRRSPSPHALRISADSHRAGGAQDGPNLSIVVSAHADQPKDSADNLHNHGVAKDSIHRDTGQVNWDPTIDKNVPNKDASVEEHPMHTKRLLEKQRERLVLIKHNCTPRTAAGESGLARGRTDDQPSNRPTPSRADYLNIRDIPSALAEKVMSDKNLFMSKKEITVQKKCLQWLNSLDIDNA